MKKHDRYFWHDVLQAIFAATVLWDMVLAPLWCLYAGHDAWKPNTLIGGGAFYIGFGGILSAGVWRKFAPSGEADDAGK